jgi:tRNA threonylcarbamoyladenosine biosynthesis protein TsaE
LFHLDLYRLETPEQIADAGLEDFLQPDGVTVIEWAEKWMNCGLRTQASPRRVADCGLFKQAKIEIIGETERRIIYDDFGA